MKYVYKRFHKVQPEDYESLDFGGLIEVDTEVDDWAADMSEEELGEELDQRMDELLAKSVERAVLLGGNINRSHIIDYYEID